MKMAVGITEEDVFVDRKDRMGRWSATESLGSDVVTPVKEIRVGIVEIKDSARILPQKEHALILCGSIEPFSNGGRDRVLSRVASRNLLVIGCLRAVNARRIV